MEQYTILFLLSDMIFLTINTESIR